MQEFIIITAVAAIYMAVHFAIRCCADADTHGGRTWWRKAIFRSEQRVQYAEFCKQIERVAEKEPQ